jgi:hypothetical protein
MIKKYILRAFVILAFFFTSPLYAENFLDEERVDDTWTVSVVEIESTPTFVLASVNGKITHGDRFFIRVPINNAEGCSYGSSGTTFYTISETHDVTKLSKKIIPAYFNKENIYVESIYSRKFLNGHRTIFNMGSHKLEGLKTLFYNQKEVSLELLDDEDMTIKNYFDITKNSFSLNGIDAALDRAKNECLKIINLNKIQEDINNY